MEPGVGDNAVDDIVSFIGAALFFFGVVVVIAVNWRAPQ
jgi:hypothetical protein